MIQRGRTKVNREIEFENKTMGFRRPKDTKKEQ